MKIHFEKVTPQHIETIFNWLAKAHVQEFWDNSQSHKDDILNFANGRREPSDYFDGLYHYFIGYHNNEPFSLVMLFKEQPEYEMPALKREHLSKEGSTYSLDFMIGNPGYLNKGLSPPTLKAFTEFVQAELDLSADTFFIDPDVTNSKAKHVYEKAGFNYIDDFIMEGNGVFKGCKTHFLVKYLPVLVTLTPATLKDYPPL